MNLITLAIAITLSASAFLLTVNGSEIAECCTGIFDEISGEITDDIINSVTPTRIAPLVYGMKVHPSVDVINKVIARGIFNVNAFDGSGRCSLSYALEEEDYAAADTLIEAGADVNAYSFSTIIVIIAQSERGDEEQKKMRIIDYLLSKGADPKSTGNSGNSALGAAAYRGHVNLVKRFLDLGLDINYQNKRRSGFTALISAAYSCWSNVETVMLLLNNGADIFIKDNGGRNAVFSALIDAALERKYEKAEYLLQYGGVSLAKDVDCNGRTAQQVLAEYYRNTKGADIIDELIAKYS
jgi:ankyrin repeat protein